VPLAVPKKTLPLTTAGEELAAKLGVEKRQNSWGAVSGKVEAGLRALLVGYLRHWGHESSGQ
jgi:hypothetical protein